MVNYSMYINGVDPSNNLIDEGICEIYKICELFIRIAIEMCLF